MLTCYIYIKLEHVDLLYIYIKLEHVDLLYIYIKLEQGFFCLQSLGPAYTPHGQVMRIHCYLVLAPS